MAVYSSENLFPQIDREFYKIECKESLTKYSYFNFFLGSPSSKKLWKKEKPYGT